jgi:hypothetical protein
VAGFGINGVRSWSSAKIVGRSVGQSVSQSVSQLVRS